MGIPGFNIWFSENYAKAYVPLGKVRVDHLYIDLNSVLHTVMRRAKNHGHFHKALHKRLHAILDATQPQKSVMIAVDGPAPLAKLLTQRDRRKKTGRTVDEGETLTGVAITPGTTFMLDLTHSLTYYICTKLSARRFRHLQFELSDGTVKGEGEVKVLGRLARPWFPEDPNDTHVILGDDADLILMALTSYKENLYVANSGLNDGRLDARVPVFSVNLLHQMWAQRMLAQVIAAGQPIASALLHGKLDLTLCAIMAKGNDYLPGLRGVSLEGSSGVWTVYQSIVSKGGERLGPSRSVTSIDPATGAPRLDAIALARLLQGSGGGGSGMGSGEWRGSKAAADPRAYLRGCVWLLQMYLTGQCPDYRFNYDGVAPSAAAVRVVCEELAAAGHSYITMETFGPADPRAAQPLLPVACALALLPAKCAHLAAPCVRHLMEGVEGPEGGGGGGAASTESGRGAALDGELFDLLYGECSECLSFAAESARLQKELATAKGRRDASVGQLKAAPRGSPEAAALQAQLEEQDAEYERVKSRYNASANARKLHIERAHPYTRFPVERLEAVAEAVVATGRISPVERPATSFGTPIVLRAFDNHYQAAAFIREANYATQGPVGPSLRQPTPGPFAAPPPAPQSFGSQQQQYRGAATWSAQPVQQQQHQRPPPIFTPPPPPFAVENSAHFASVVRQEILSDEHGCGAAVSLQVAHCASDGSVQYLLSDAAAQQQRSQQAHKGTAGGPRQQRPQGQGPAPRAHATAAIAVQAQGQGVSVAAAVQVRVQQTSQAPRPAGQAQPPAAVPPLAAVAVAAQTAPAAAGLQHPQPESLAPGQPRIAPAPAAPPAVSQQPRYVDSIAAAGSASPEGSPAAGAEPAAGRKRRGRKAKPDIADEHTAAASSSEDGTSPNEAAASVPPPRRRGRAPGSKNKSGAAEGGSPPAAGSRSRLDAASGGSAVGAAPAATSAATAAMHGFPAPPPPPPMPSSRLLSSALAGATGPRTSVHNSRGEVQNHSGYPYQPQPIRPYPAYPPGGPAPETAGYYAGPSYGYNAPTSCGYGQPSPPGPAYGAANPVASVRPVLYRPTSPSAAAAAAAAAAAQSRGRPPAVGGPRWT